MHHRLRQARAACQIRPHDLIVSETLRPSTISRIDIAHWLGLDSSIVSLWKRWRVLRARQGSGTAWNRWSADLTVRGTGGLRKRRALSGISMREWSAQRRFASECLVDWARMKAATSR